MTGQHPPDEPDAQAAASAESSSTGGVDETALRAKLAEKIDDYEDDLVEAVETGDAAGQLDVYKEFVGFFAQRVGDDESFREMVVKAAKQAAKNADDRANGVLLVPTSKKTLRAEWNTNARPANAQRPHLVDDILPNVERVVKVSTDSGRDKHEFEVHFADHAEPLRISSGEYHRASNFGEAYNRQFDDLPFWPSGEGAAEHWRNGLQQHINARGVITVRVEDSEEMMALDRLRARVQASPAYTDPNVAHQRSGVYVDAATVEEGEDADVVWVASHIVEDATDDLNISEFSKFVSAEDVIDETGETTPLRVGNERHGSPQRRFWGFRMNLTDPDAFSVGEVRDGADVDPDDPPQDNTTSLEDVDPDPEAAYDVKDEVDPDDTPKNRDDDQHPQ